MLIKFMEPESRLAIARGWVGGCSDVFPVSMHYF